MGPTTRAAIVLGASLAVPLLGAPRAAAQPAEVPVVEITEELDFERTEAWAMQYAASLSLLTGFGAAPELEPGAVELGLEGMWIPSLSEAERTVGFDGTKTEDLNKTSVFGRPRLLVGLPNRLSLEASYVPPVKVFDLTPHLFAVAVGRSIAETRRWRLGLRLAAQYGTLEGDFTCTEAEVAAGADRQRNPFRCRERSDDEITIRTASLEFAARRRLPSLPWQPFVTVGVSRMDLDFQVDALHSGIDDRTRLETAGQNVHATVGADYRAAERWSWAGELFYSPLEVVRPPRTSSQTDGLLHARVMLRYKLR